MLIWLYRSVRSEVEGVRFFNILQVLPGGVHLPMEASLVLKRTSRGAIQLIYYSSAVSAVLTT